MSNTKKQETIDDRADQSNGDDYTDTSSVSSTGDVSNVGSREIGLTERLTDIFVDERDGDLLLQHSDREDRVLQWLQALDMQVMGACRADERLKPLLKSNASCGIAEDRLLAHLSQHFEPSEVCMLARCFCIPLVSIRVGKINKQGTLLCPTSVRGNLSLTILPTSDLRLSFIGDDGHTERLLTLSSKSECSAVVIDDILADNSGRSFLVKSPDGRAAYFWCSERSKLLGIELISKMKDLIMRKPSISELTGISESRLGYLATHLRAYLVGSSLTNARATCTTSLAHSFGTPSELSDSSQNGQCSSTSLKSLRSRHSGSQAFKANSLYQGEKLRRRGDGYLSAVDNLPVTLPVTTDELFSNQSETDNDLEAKSCQLSPSSLEPLGKLAVPPTSTLATQVPSIGSPLFSPYYCWCPLGSSSLQSPTTPPLLPQSLLSESPSVPPLSSLLSVTASSNLLKPTAPRNLTDIPSLDFPAFLPDPLVRLQVPSSQQIPTFTPLICDPIVHIPVIDVCSSGQGYLVSAGPTISTTIPPLHPKLVNPLIPEGDSVVENGARETLRLLISSSSQTNPPLMDVLPAVLTSANETQSMLVAGSRGLYCGTRDVDAIRNSIALVSLAGSSSIGDTIVVKRRDSLEKLDGQSEDKSVPSGCCLDEERNLSANLKEQRTD
ncbi:Flocculation protein [Melia azedarach]|uniref:Flocculation protein n=1 Tax=Melia azedarach TaxID=155640 RepID=A0ACC1Y8V7_MELAZ|nr:Flocculation protein [Melia azedarach]